MGHHGKPRPQTPNIMNGISQPIDILENQAANNQLQATMNKTTSVLGKCADLQYGRTYPDNDRPFATIDFKTGVITCAFNPETGESITRNEMQAMDMTYSQLISQGRHKKSKTKIIKRLVA